VEHMVKLQDMRAFAAGTILLAGFGLLAAGCFGGGDEGATTASTSRTPQSVSSATTTTTLALDLGASEAEDLSTFKSKDPFIQQGVVVESTSSTSTTGDGQTTTTRFGGSTSTTRYSGSTTTTKPGSTTSSVPASTTSTTAAHLHTLKILSVNDVGGAAAVTFKVDDGVYRDKRVGDVVSTSWGQIKVLDLSTSSKVATLLQGSETLVLSVGQVVYE
jgi:hypothetical protein